MTVVQSISPRLRWIIVPGSWFLRVSTVASLVPVTTLSLLHLGQLADTMTINSVLVAVVTPHVAPAATELQPVPPSVVATANWQLADKLTIMIRLAVHPTAILLHLDMSWWQIKTCYYVQCS